MKLNSTSPTGPRLHLAAVTALASGLLTIPALAEPPVWASLLSTGGPGSFPGMPACEMTFDAGWKDMAKAGQLKVTVVPSGDTIKVMGTGANVGAAAALLPIEGEFVALIDGTTLEPKLMEQTEKRKDSVLLAQVEFAPGKVMSTKTLRVGGSGEEIKVSKETVVPRAFDLVSAALFLRSQPLAEVGESYTLAVVPQSSPKPLTVTVVARGQYEWQGEMIDAVKVEVKPTKFEAPKKEKKPEGEEEKKSVQDRTKEIFKGGLGAMTGWISDDERRLPLEVSVEIAPIGAVGVKLVEYKEG